MTTRTSKPPPWLKQGQVMAAIAKKRLAAAGLLAPEGRAPQNEQTRWTGRYQRNLIGFCEDVLGMTPWSFTPLEGMPPEMGAVLGNTGQREVLLAIQESVRRQLDGEEDVPYIIAVEAPHGCGKTYGIEAPVMAWFYRCFAPAVVMSTANSITQVRDNLWKNIRQHAGAALRSGRDVVPGLVPKGMRAELSADHFMSGFVTSDAGGAGVERAQGQHNEYQLWVFDEGEGVQEFMFEAVKRQLTGNRVRLWVIMANPKTSSSSFQEIMRHPLCLSFRMSLLSFPNVVLGQAVVPGGTKRSTFNEWVEDQRTFGTEVVPAHDESEYTFEVPWAIPKSGGGEHPPGTIFRPKRGLLYGALGIPPSGGGGDTFISAGRYEAALARAAVPVPVIEYRDHFGLREERHIWAVQIGIDCARYGNDAGTVYALAHNALRFEAAIHGVESDVGTLTRRYVNEVRATLQKYAALGCTRASVRVDAGYGQGIIDSLREQEDLRLLFADGYVVHEVYFGGTPADPEMYADLSTEMYALADEVLKDVQIVSPAPPLKRDLTERKYGFISKGSRDVRKLEKKNDFKRRNKGASPDDGDGAVLALAPERLFIRSSNAAAIAELDELNDLL